MPPFTINLQAVIRYKVDNYYKNKLSKSVYTELQKNEHKFMDSTAIKRNKRRLSA